MDEKFGPTVMSVHEIQKKRGNLRGVAIRLESANLSLSRHKEIHLPTKSISLILQTSDSWFSDYTHNLEFWSFTVSTTLEFIKAILITGT